MLSEKTSLDVQQLQTDLKEEFPVKQCVAYFNNASYTPMSKSAISAIAEVLAEYSKKGPSDEYYQKLKVGGEVAREKLSKLINAPKEDIVFTESATQSINLVANGFRLSRSDCILTRGGSSEHPSNFLPWKYYAERKQASIIDLRTDDSGMIDLSDLDSSLKQTRAKLVVMSHVLYNLGTIIPVAEVSRIAHERGSLFFLDASQSVGSIPLDLKSIDCDYAAGTAAKWLCGPLGLGFFYCKKSALDHLEPLNFGPNACTYAPDGTFKVSDSAARLQEGFRNWAYCYGLIAAIDLLNSFDLAHVREKDLHLADMIIEELSENKSFRLIGSTDKRTRTSIIPYETRNVKPIDVVQKLSKANIVVAEREIRERKILRISPHFYNDEEEITHLVKELRDIAC
jgi:cysteine desulfurase / selenocysteine lyase